MKRKKFDRYFDLVMENFGFDILTDSRIRKYTEARFVLYYLCRENNLRLEEIQEFLQEKGFNVSHTNIVHGHRNVSAILEHGNDKDLQELIDSCSENTNQNKNLNDDLNFIQSSSRMRSKLLLDLNKERELIKNKIRK